MTRPRRTGTASIAYDRLRAILGDSYTPPGGNKSRLRLLAHMAEVTRHLEGWEEIRRQVNYVVGPSRADGLLDTPMHGLSGWQEHAVRSLAIINKDAGESLLLVPGLKSMTEHNITRRLQADWPEPTAPVRGTA